MESERRRNNYFGYGGEEFANFPTAAEMGKGADPMGIDDPAAVQSGLFKAIYSNTLLNIIKGTKYWYFYDTHIKSWTVFKVDKRNYQIGEVNLTGGISGGSAGTVAFNLPAGYRPLYRVKNVVPGGEVQIDTNGNVTVVSGTTLYVDQVRFTASP
jgi:hypothetical protein